MLRVNALDLMSKLKLRGMASVYDEVMVTGRKGRVIPEKIIIELLKAEAAERHLRSICYRMGQAKLPMQKDLDTFDFKQAMLMNVKSAPCMRVILSSSISI